MSHDLPAAACQIPKLTILRNDINYGMNQRMTSTFWKQVQYFRETYRTQRIEGRHYLQWKDTTHRQGLSKMAEDFLLENGARWWPGDPANPQYNTLQYSKDFNK